MLFWDLLDLSLIVEDQNDQKKAYERDEYKQKTKTQRKLPVTLILGDSLVKDIKSWELSDESNNVVTKHFSGANTTDMKPIYCQSNHANQKISFFIAVQTIWRKKTVQTKSEIKLLKLPCCVNLIATMY